DGIVEQGRPCACSQCPAPQRTPCASARSVNGVMKRPNLFPLVGLMTRTRKYLSKSTTASAGLGHVPESKVFISAIDPTPSYLWKSGCLKPRWCKLCCTYVLHECDVLR
ncbi:unnamed protein product, partial [Sphacelaria rigidula]